MNSIRLLAALAASITLTATSANAALIADFQLNNSLANAAGGGVTLTNNGVLGATGITFDANDGPTISGLGVLSVYTLETEFTFDNVSGYRKIADFKNLASDAGLYILSGRLNFYPLNTGASLVSASDAIKAKLTRDSTGLVSTYMNDVFQFSFNDTAGLAIIEHNLNLFHDDDATGGGESSSGFVNYVTITSGMVPEPATWALMIGGFGAAGAMLRRRRSTAFG